MSVFGAEYAAAYDTLYEDKDYDAECDLIEDVFRRFSAGSVVNALDLGCGTGSHATRLAQRGYAVVGVDRSEDMLRQARARGSSARFVQGDITSIALDQTFDAVLMMFAVLGYQTTNRDITAAIAAARRHVRPGGLFFADVWYGPSVLFTRPADRVKVIETPGGQVIRAAAGELNTHNDLCTVRYQLWRIEHGQVTASVHEAHPMRYFFAPELELLLSCGGFELQRLGAFPNLDDEPSEQTWNVAFVARAS